MNDETVTSDAKIKANQENALKSTGPKTPRGKRFSRRNALKHGLYSKEVFPSDPDNPDFVEVRRDLERQYKPASPTQCIAFDSIVYWTWETKLATRLQHRQLTRILKASDPLPADSSEPLADPNLSRWYGFDRRSIRNGIKVLEHARAEFKNLNYFHEDTKQLLARGFGPEFVETLTHWIPMDQAAVLLANHLVGHQKLYGGDLYPEGVQPPENIVLDPSQAFQMVDKLLYRQRCFLEDVLTMRGQSGSDAEMDRQTTDFNPDFLAKATRELRRAVDWFLYLKEVGL